MKILQVALGNQFDIRDALLNIGDVVYWDWSHQHKTFNTQIKRLVDYHKPDLVWLQVQSPNIINLETAYYLSKHTKVVNWTGDVRAPLPKWFIECGKHFHLTLFTNMNDVVESRNKGIRSDYLQIGFPEKIFNDKVEPNKNAPKIIFMGSNQGSFPLSPLRKKMVDLLRTMYGKDFQVFGTNWGAHNYIHDQKDECAMYRGCKIAINLSHFDYSRYSSDRIFRIMGSGAFCLSHNYRDIKLEFGPDEHLATWQTFTELTEKINHFLNPANDKERLRIAKNGYNLVHKTCTWENRINQLTQLLNAY